VFPFGSASCPLFFRSVRMRPTVDTEVFHPWRTSSIASLSLPQRGY
jgi:hypothetical protein